VGNNKKKNVSTLGDLEQMTLEDSAPKDELELSPRVTELEITGESDRLKLSVHEQVVGEESTIRHYEEIPVSMEMIQTKCRELVDTLNKANRKGRLNPEILAKLRENGQVLHDELFSLTAKETLKKTVTKYLTLKTDDRLVQLPWELLHDGQNFLCQRFNMGRLVKTQQAVRSVGTRFLSRPLNMLILADPKGDLKGAYAEGIQIRNYADHNQEFINASLRSSDITPEFVKQKIRNFDLVHFAGHAEYDVQNVGHSGWQLTSGNLRAIDITKMSGTGTMPALIFSNACQSARSEEWKLSANFEDEVFGLANSFLLTGVKHYVGTFWEILDEPSSFFALAFYKYLLSGMTIGRAIRESRLALIREYGEETIVWASYVLYGDPTFNYKKQHAAPDTKSEPAPTHILTRHQEAKTREDVIDFVEKKTDTPKWTWWPIATSLVLVLALILWVYPGLKKEDTLQYERTALAHYNQGNFQKALDVCKILDDKRPETSLTYLIRGNIYLANGKLDAAEAEYHKGLQVQKQTEVQKAQVLAGLGRIASLQKQPDAALRYYQQATEAAPKNSVGYVSQALVLEERRDYENALDLLEKARALEPQNRVLAAITHETRQRVAINRDQKKQERLDRLVKELLETMEEAPSVSSIDDWTSLPLTLWIMNFETQGYSIQEGQESLLVSGISAQMLQHSRARLVERSLLNKLVEELRLGTSKLIDRSTALSLGRILAARLIISGHMVYTGPLVQISMRLIETETGQIIASISESFGSADTASVIVDRLSKKLLQKLMELYPLRGKISEVKDTEFGLNIGEMVGAQMGQRFRVIDEDEILEIISTRKDSSLAKVVRGKGLLQAGSRVEIIQYPLN
jgi:CHAT domain-containing protein/Tfp pilus assembly protein PilF